jgi:hypothetical protein
LRCQNVPEGFLTRLQEANSSYYPAHRVTVGHNLIFDVATDNACAARIAGRAVT